MDLTGKVALVTGASSGIGAATAAVLADLGAGVAIGYHRNQEGAVRVRERIAAAGGTAVAIGADLCRVEDVRSLVARTVDELGPIDILVNNAGSLVGRMRVLELDETRVDEILTLNLKSAMFCAQAVAASMIERKTGAVVNVGSIAGHNGGGPGAGTYAAAKSGLMAFTKSLAKELAPHGIRVNGVSPGVVNTPFHDVFSTPEMMRGFVAAIPLGRIGQPIECAKVIAFLASEGASYVVGETIEVNGGQLML